MRTSGITAMPCSILRVSIWNLNLVFEPHIYVCMCKQTESLPPLFFFFRQVMVAFVFFGGSMHRSNLSNKTKKAGRLSICWLVHGKHHAKKTQTSKYARKIERGIAKQRLYQHLSWLSSYCRSTHVTNKYNMISASWGSTGGSRSAGFNMSNCLAFIAQLVRAVA